MDRSCRCWRRMRLQFRHVYQRPPAGPLRADFGDDDAVPIVHELTEDLLQLGRGIGAAQRPLIVEHLL